MNIVTFFDLDESVIDKKYNVKFYKSECYKDCEVALLNIESIFDYEEHKHSYCQDNFISIAVIEDWDDYDAFKNFGIDSWIKFEDISKLNDLIALAQKKLAS